MSFFKVPVQAFDTLTPAEKLVLVVFCHLWNAHRRQPFARSTRDLAQLTALSKTTLANSINRLIDLGHLTREDGSGRLPPTYSLPALDTTRTPYPPAASKPKRRKKPEPNPAQLPLLEGSPDTNGTQNAFTYTLSSKEEEVYSGSESPYSEAWHAVEAFWIKHRPSKNPGNRSTQGLKHGKPRAEKLKKAIAKHGGETVLNAFRWILTANAWAPSQLRERAPTGLFDTIIRHVDRYAEYWEEEGPGIVNHSYEADDRPIVGIAPQVNGHHPDEVYL